MKHPKHLEFSMPPEWHQHEACWMAWPTREEIWNTIGMERARAAYATVAQAIAMFEPVNMLTNAEDCENARELCGPGIEIIPLPINDSWTRDNGPSFLLDPQQRLAGVAWKFNAWGDEYTNYELDQKVAREVLTMSGAQIFEAPLIMEGGSFSVDGAGRVLVTKQCLLNPNRNPGLSQSDIEKYLQEFLGVEQVIWLHQGLYDDETDGHVDEIACFVGPGKVLALTTTDPDDVNYANMQENIQILKEHDLEVVTVHQPPAEYINTKRLSMSYINFYIANGGIVMPAAG